GQRTGRLDEDLRPPRQSLVRAGGEPRSERPWGPPLPREPVGSPGLTKATAQAPPDAVRPVPGLLAPETAAADLACWPPPPFVHLKQGPSEDPPTSAEPGDRGGQHLFPMVGWTRVARSGWCPQLLGKGSPQGQRRGREGGQVWAGAGTLHRQAAGLTLTKRVPGADLRGTAASGLEAGRDSGCPPEAAGAHHRVSPGCRAPTDRRPGPHRSLAVGPQYASLGTQPTLCASIPGLVPKQLRFCRNYVEIMPSVAEGVKVSIQECQHQFRGRRWNCTTVSHSLAIFGPVLDRGTRCQGPHRGGLVSADLVDPWGGLGAPSGGHSLGQLPVQSGRGRAGALPPTPAAGAELGARRPTLPAAHQPLHPSAATRESAFVHAIASAGVAFSVTRACAEGAPAVCGCSSRHQGSPGDGWKWGGCSEDIEFGGMVSREFADARENRPDARSAMNRHNNEAGRQAIASHMHLKCKCHGLSGSCEVKTCWWSQPDFRAIGDFLKDKYDSASEMVVEKHRESRGWVETLRPRYTYFKAPTERDLVYYEASPNFCEPNAHTGSFGTRDRACNVSSPGIDGCDLLCCGRGHDARTERRREKCRCVFHWCCYVSCQECARAYEVHTCK
ncbi:Protein Wnt-3a, partial [Galemys pyrenaicus]